MQCPTVDELRACVESDTIAKAVLYHVSECPKCQQRVAELSGDAKTLEEIRAAWSSRLDEATQRRVDEVCREATAKDPKR